MLGRFVSNLSNSTKKTEAPVEEETEVPVEETEAPEEETGARRFGPAPDPWRTGGQNGVYVGWPPKTKGKEKEEGEGRRNAIRNLDVLSDARSGCTKLRLTKAVMAERSLRKRSM